MGPAGSLGILLAWLALLLVLGRVAGIGVPSERRLRGAFALLAILLLAASVPLVARLWDYTADDAYLLARYGAQLVELGQPVYNPGEPVNAVTAPLTVLEMALLYAVAPRQVMTLHKSLCVALAVAGLALVWRRTRSAAAFCVFVSLVAVSSFHGLWLVGGLETPILAFLLLLFTLAALRRPPRHPPTAPLTTAADDNVGLDGSDSDPPPPLRSALAAALLAGLAFAARYDSAVFTLPALGFLAWRRRRWREAAAVLACGALLPAALLAFNLFYYGDALPTSFHLKARAALGWPGLAYVVEFFLYSGLFALLVFVGATRGTGGPTWRERLRRDASLPLWAGAFLFCVPYATFTATTHMMYGFRAFVPYLVVLAYLLSRQVAAGERRRDGDGRPYLEGLLATVLVVVLTQAATSAVMPRSSLNASRVGEFRAHWDIPSYLDALTAAAAAVDEDWRARGGNGRLRIYSPNEGIVGFALLDASVYGRLTGYRRACPVALVDYARAAHYAIVEEPFLALHLKGIDLAAWEPIYRSGEFERGHHARQRSRVLAYRNPDPVERDVAYRVGDPCPEDRPVRPPG